jgi:hypothetical protein
LPSTVYFQEAQKLQTPGRIYRKDNLLYVNEYFKGIHIIDNTSPSAPRKIGFIHIPGNVNMSIKGNYLYANNSTDLVIMDITNPVQAKEVGRIPQAFGKYTDAVINEEDEDVIGINPAKGIIVGYRDTLVVEETGCN